MVKVSHEVPICLLNKSRDFNDYDYCLPHLLDKNLEYEKYFRDAKEKGRYIIMDNSLHELGKALDSSIKVRSLEDPNHAFMVGRQLAVMNHTFDARNVKGEIRLELDFTTQTRDLLIHNFIHHIRRMIVSAQGIMVEM